MEPQNQSGYALQQPDNQPVRQQEEAFHKAFARDVFDPRHDPSSCGQSFYASPGGDDFALVVMGQTFQGNVRKIVAIAGAKHVQVEIDAAGAVQIPA